MMCGHRLHTCQTHGWVCDCLCERDMNLEWCEADLPDGTHLHLEVRQRLRGWIIEVEISGLDSPCYTLGPFATYKDVLAEACALFARGPVATAAVVLLNADT